MRGQTKARPERVPGTDWYCTPTYEEASSAIVTICDKFPAEQVTDLVMFMGRYVSRHYDVFGIDNAYEQPLA